jgi:GH18 family chitinase
MAKPIFGFYSGCVHGDPSTVLASIDFTKMDYCIFEYLQATGADNDTLILQNSYPTSIIEEFFAVAKAANPSIKCQICYADGLNGMGNYHLLQDDVHRASVISQLVTWMNADYDGYTFDGINLDVEYSPLWAGLSAAEYDVFMAELRVAMDVANPTKELTACLLNMEAANHNNFTTTGEAELDYVLMMNYTAWSGNAPGFDALPEWHQYTGLGIRGTYQALYKDVIISLQIALTFGFSASKLVMGIPAIFYPDNKGVWILWSYITATIDPDDDVDEWFGASYNTTWDVPWDWLGGSYQIYNDFIWFNNVDTVKQKIDYVKGQGLAGAFLYEVGSDSFDAHSLLAAAYDRMNNESSSPPNTIVLNASKLVLLM